LNSAYEDEDEEIRSSSRRGAPLLCCSLADGRYARRNNQVVATASPGAGVSGSRREPEETRMRKRPEDHFAFDSKYDFDVRPATYWDERGDQGRIDERDIVEIGIRSGRFDVIVLQASLHSGRIHYRVVDEYHDEGEEFIIKPKTSAEPLTFGTLITLLDSSLPAEGHRHGEEELDVGLFERFLYMNLEGEDAWDLVDLPWARKPGGDFVSVSSRFYPQLSDYYHDRALAWYLKVEGDEWLAYLEGELAELKQELAEYDEEALAFVHSHAWSESPLRSDYVDRAAAALLIDGRLDEAEALAAHLEEVGGEGTWILAHVALGRGDRLMAARLAQEAGRY
jgi:hypothetical protein